MYKIKRIIPVILVGIFVLTSFVFLTQAQTIPNVYGIHTTSYGSLEETRKQLNWAKALTGPNGHVKQLFYPVTKTTTGPSQSAKDFVNEAYARGLNPVLRLQGTYDESIGWIKPEMDGTGLLAYKYTKVAAGYKKFVSGLPRVNGRTLYIEIWNEPNLHHEWSGAANAKEYSRFFVDTAAAIHAIGDKRIKVLNGALSPGGNVDNLQFIQLAINADSKFKTSFDVWASHPYSRNVPPEINLHDKTAPADSRDTIDAYMQELSVLKKNGVNTAYVKVMATEAGYRLFDSWHAQYPAINETNRADYTKRAFENYWSKWPELIAVMPFQLSDSNGTWWDLDWVHSSSSSDGNNFPTQPHLQYAKVMRGTGIIQGIVKDEHGNPLKDMEITANANGHKAVSLQDGSYTMIAYPGTYTITATNASVSASLENVIVSLNNSTGADFVLQTGVGETLPATVQNAGFETGDLSYWTPYGAVDGVQTGTWFTDITAHEGNYFFGTASNWGAKNGGIYQRLSATPGKTQTVTAWIRTYVEGSGALGNRIGIDPNGGIDPTAASVVWTNAEQNQGSWRHLSISTPTQNDAITVFVDFNQSYGNVWNINSFDLVTKSEE